MLGIITEYIGQIILVILALVTLRDVIARILGIPRHWKISNLFYSQYDRDTFLEIFKAVGIEELKFHKRVRNLQNNHNAIIEPKERLVYLISKYIYDFKTEYGSNTPTKTNYYINTMEASHYPLDLELMTNLIANLIDCKEGNVHQDFIISPKCGNPMLGHNYTSLYNNLFLLSKYEKDKSRSKSNDPLTSLMINFEGFASLKMEAEKNPTRNYYGYMIDCNLSGGSLVINPIKEFNRNIELLHSEKKLTNIKPLKEAFILFRADNDMTESGPFDNVFAESGLKCHRYFDLDENLKSILFEFKVNKEPIICRCLSNKRENFFKEFISNLDCKGFLKN